MQQRPDYQSGPSYKAEIRSTWPGATCITSFLISCIEPTIQRGIMGPLQVNPLHLRVLKVDPRSQSCGWRKRRWRPVIVMHPRNPSLPCAHCPIHASQGGWEESQGHPHPHPVSTCTCKGHPPSSSSCFHPSGCCHLIHMEIFPFVRYIRIPHICQFCGTTTPKSAWICDKIAINGLNRPKFSLLMITGTPAWKKYTTAGSGGSD